MTNVEMYLAEVVTEKSMRDGFGEGLVQLARVNDKIVAIDADLVESVRLNAFQKEFPERFIEVGIAEQNMMGVAAGMALSGLVPFACSYAAFNPGRNWDQLRLSVCLSRANVKIVGGHAGFGNGVDGANQQAFEDIAIARVLPNLTVLAPADFEQAKKMVALMAEWDGPVYMRMTKPVRPCLTTKMTPLQIGKGQLFRAGTDVTVVANGMMVAEAMKAAEELDGELSVEVLNIHTIKPFDEEILLRSVAKTKSVVVAEEHSIIGGLYSAVAEVLSEKLPSKVLGLGMRDCFGESGDPGELCKKYGLTKDGIINRIREVIN